MTEFFKRMNGHEYWNNSPLEWLLAFGVFATVAASTRLVQALLIRYLGRAAEKTLTEVDDAWVSILGATSWYFHLAAATLVAQKFLDLTSNAHDVVRAALYVCIGVQVAVWAQRALTTFLDLWAKKQNGNRKHTAAGAVRFIGRLAIWSIFVLVVLSNLGVELSAVVAGLGVGGVAAALAVQSILSDLFAGLSMYFDRPFDLGDFIIVGDVLGNVRKIGLRTTRIDSLGGEEIIFPNGELVKQAIRNYQRMKERRIVFSFGIEYNLTVDKVEAARDTAQRVIEERDGVRFDRAHFKQFGDSSLDFEVVYYVLSKEYDVYMEHQHAINMALYREFEQQGIPFAFPSRSIYMRTSES